jgi:hypothetical protein
VLEDKGTEWFRREQCAHEDQIEMLERLATSDKVTIVVERPLNGNMRITSGSWDNEKVILPNEVVEVRNVNGRLHVARKPRRHDEWGPYIPPYDPYGPGTGVIGSRDDEFIDD